MTAYEEVEAELHLSTFAVIRKLENLVCFILRGKVQGSN
jgi:hypothetical protein